MITPTMLDSHLDSLFGLSSVEATANEIDHERIATLQARTEQLMRQHEAFCKEREWILTKSLKERDACLKEQRTYLERLEHEVSERTQELREETERLARANERMKRDLDSAARIQKSLLPTQLPDMMGFRFAHAFQPCDELAGDSLNVFPLDDRHIGLYLLDVSGHGVPAALLSVTLSQFLLPGRGPSSLVKRKCQQPPGWEVVAPAHVASQLNERFLMDDDNEQYFTMVYGILDMQERCFRYISAGHPGLVYAAAGEPATILGRSSFAIGWVEKAEWKEHSVQLSPGDRLYLYSDGITEAIQEDNEQFGSERLCTVIENTRESSIDDSVKALLEAVVEWTDGNADDDVSVVALEVTSEDIRAIRG